MRPTLPVFVAGATPVLDPRETVINPHTHQEAPVVPVYPAVPSMVATVTGNGTIAQLPHGVGTQLVLQNPGVVSRGVASAAGEGEGH